MTLDVGFGGVGDDPWGNTRALFSVKGKLDRTDWGMTWNQALETGGVVVSRSLDLEVIRQS